MLPVPSPINGLGPGHHPALQLVNTELWTLFGSKNRRRKCLKKKTFKQLWIGQFESCGHAPFFAIMLPQRKATVIQGTLLDRGRGSKENVESFRVGQDVVLGVEGECKTFVWIKMWRILARGERGRKIKGNF